MKTERTADIVTGIFLALLAGALLVAAVKIPYTAEQRLRPGAAPTLLSIAAIAMSFLLVLHGWRDRGQSQPIDWPTRSGAWRVLATAIGIGIYLACLEFLGFPLASAIFVGSLCWYLGRYPAWVSLCAGVGTGVLIYFGFARALGLGLPLGLLESLF